VLHDLYIRYCPIIPKDNTHPHVSTATLQRLNEFGYEVLPHPPYSLDQPLLGPKNFHFKRCCKDIFLEFVVSRIPEFNKIRIENLVSRWEKCINVNGCYFN